MDLLTRSEIESLAAPEAGDSQVSLFMPTHRFGGGVDADQLHWKNLVNGVEAVLAQRMRRPDVDELLAPARQLEEAGMDWQYMSDGLAMFLRKGWHRTFRIPASMPELATVGNRLVMGPMLRLLSGDEHFLLLALSQQEIRLLDGSRNTVDQVQMADVPTSLRDVVKPLDPRSDTMARPAAGAGRGGPAVFYGHGAGDQNVKKTEVTRFLRAVSTGLHDILAGQTSPMVLVGLEHLVAAYREVNTYPNLTEEAVQHNTDHLSAEELHQLAWPLVEEQLRNKRAAAIEQFHSLNGTGRVSADLHTVVRAAADGRVETLFVKADPWCWERISTESPAIVLLDTDQRFADCEQVDAAAVATLSGGGQIYATSQTVVSDREVAAIFRY